LQPEFEPSFRGNGGGSGRWPGPDGSEPGISRNYLWISGFARLGARPGMTGALRPRALVSHRQQFHRPVGNHDAEGRPDGALDQRNLAAMGTHQLGGDGEP
jgi:hypothetical protein